jgi:peroxiredoxin
MPLFTRRMSPGSLAAMNPKAPSLALSLGLGLCLLLTLGSRAQAQEPPQVGRVAPTFELRDEAGKEHSLAAYRGKVVVLEWVNPDCPFVVRHYQERTMQTTLEAFDGKPVVWLAVDSSAHNTAKRSAAWKQDAGFSWPVLQDPDGAVGKAFAAKTTPHMYVIDPEGVLRYEGAIDDDPRGKKKEGRVNHVRQAVEAVLEGKPVPSPTTKAYGCSVKYKS